MGFTVEQDCPQCGAPIDIDETDRVMRCPYCDVRHFLFAPTYFRFMLPHKTTVDQEIIYSPYLRFKGNVYYCQGWTVGHRVVDITHVGLHFPGIPVSLGLRPQAMKMRFVDSSTPGSFLRFTLKASEIVTRAGDLSSATGAGKLLHRAYIGETLSLIYLPLFIKGDRLFDGVLNRPLSNIPEGEDILTASTVKNPRWKISFLPTLCPRCGWNLEGERDSMVLTCSNCETAWEASKGRFIPVKFLTVPGQGPNTVYLPFWRTGARAKGVEINSFADFIRLTNQPRVVGKEWENEDMYFWAPAFKIRPRIFLNLSRQMTLSQKRFAKEEMIPKKDLYPVTLPSAEAAQAMKLTLAMSTINKKDVFPALPRITFEVKDSTLVYLPFTDTGYEIIQQHMQTSINKNTLEFGRKL